MGLYLLLQFSLETHNFNLFIHQKAKLFITFRQIHSLQESLLIVIEQRQVDQHLAHQLLQIGLLQNLTFHILVHLAIFLAVKAEDFRQIPNHGFPGAFRQRLQLSVLLKPDNFRLQIVPFFRKMGQFPAFQALGQHTDNFLGHLDDLFYRCDGSDTVEIIRSRIFHLYVLLGYQKDSLITQHGFFDGFHRALPAHVKMYYHVGKDGHSA